jgi:hypothetical protein
MIGIMKNILLIGALNKKASLLGGFFFERTKLRLLNPSVEVEVNSEKTSANSEVGGVNNCI